VLQARGVQLGFPGLTLLSGWCHDLPAGLSLVLGDEGAGKTSMLRLLAGELAPAPGRLCLRGVDAATAPDRYRAQVFWRDPRAPWPAALTPAAWAQALAARHPRWREDEWLRHAAGFLVGPHLHKTMDQLSTGTQRKVLLAGALASGAPPTPLDEPVAALDKAAIGYLQGALQREAATPPWPERAVVVAHYDTLGGLPWRSTVALPSR